MSTVTDVSITSFSRLSCYQTCPRKFAYEYVSEAHPECTPLALVFGSAIHEAIELHFKFQQKGLVADVPEMMAAFRASMSGALDVANLTGVPIDLGGQTMQDVMGKAQDMLVAFHSDVDRSGKVLDTELEFNVELAPGIVLKGFIDALLFDGDGHYRIVELKTSSASYGEDKLLYDHQPTTYLSAIEKLIGPAKSLTFEFWVLTKTKSPQLKYYAVHRDARARQELVETIGEVNALVQSGAFPRRRCWACSGCQFAKRCSGA